MLSGLSQVWTKLCDLIHILFCIPAEHTLVALQPQRCMKRMQHTLTLCDKVCCKTVYLVSVIGVESSHVSLQRINVE